MSQTLRSSNGQFAGSIGPGKASVPTPRPPVTAPGAPSPEAAPARLSVEDLWASYTASRDIPDPAPGRRDLGEGLSCTTSQLALTRGKSVTRVDITGLVGRRQVWVIQDPFTRQCEVYYDGIVVERTATMGKAFDRVRADQRAAVRHRDGDFPDSE